MGTIQRRVEEEYSDLLNVVTSDDNAAQLVVRLRILSDADDKGGGLIATLGGARQRMSAVLLLASLIRWPLGSLQGAALIGWQALKLRLKGERYRPRPRTKGTA